MSVSLIQDGEGEFGSYDAVQMMHAFNIHQESSAILIRSLDKLRIEAALQSIFF